MLLLKILIAGAPYMLRYFKNNNHGSILISILLLSSMLSMLLLGMYMINSNNIQNLTNKKQSLLIDAQAHQLCTILIDCINETIEQNLSDSQIYFSIDKDVDIYENLDILDELDLTIKRHTIYKIYQEIIQCFDTIIDNNSLIYQYKLNDNDFIINTTLAIDNISHKINPVIEYALLEKSIKYNIYTDIINSQLLNADSIYMYLELQEIINSQTIKIIRIDLGISSLQDIAYTLQQNSDIIEVSIYSFPTIVLLGKYEIQ